MNARVLVVDDDPGLIRLLALRLGAMGYDVVTAASGEEGLARASERPPDVVVTDMRMPGVDGLGLYEGLRRRFPTLPVIVLTAHGTIPDAVEATRRGMFAYLTKPFDSRALLDCVAAALRITGVDANTSAETWRASMLTRSPLMEDLLRRTRLVAESDASVLIQGESGTGKELLAAAIHDASRRQAGPFVPVNCAAIPETLFEAELFGFRKGAFSGATEDRAGLLVSANGGTLFLDEIGDMPLTFQAKLLRALQEREVRAVGATRTVPIDVRVVSATHADLEASATAGRFRSDLLYRLNVVTLELPPLHARREDIPLLARKFLEELATRHDRPARVFASEALELLVAARWPGNVRQLRNVVEQCVALATSAIIPTHLVQQALRNPQTTLPTLDEARQEAEVAYLVQALQLAHGNVSQAARFAGRNRTEFYKLLGRHGLDATRFRGES